MMRNERRYKLGIGLTLALAATALGGTSAWPFPHLWTRPQPTGRRASCPRPRAHPTTTIPTR